MDFRGPVRAHISHTDLQQIQQARLAARDAANPDPQPEAVLCPIHAHLGDTPALFNAIREENDRKNGALYNIGHTIIASAPDIPKPKSRSELDDWLANLGMSPGDADGEIRPFLNDWSQAWAWMVCRAAQWEFDSQRALHIKFPISLPLGRKVQLQQELDSQMGVNRVQVA